MYKRVVNKHARHNLCYDVAVGKGTVIAFESVPLLQTVLEGLPAMLGEKSRELKCELNKYYEPSNCVIGFHGDAERKRVVAVHLGVSIPMVFFAFQRHQPMIVEGAELRTELTLAHGDIYVMSEKATGFDWKRSSIPTLRHAAGYAKYTAGPGGAAKRKQADEPLARTRSGA